MIAAPNVKVPSTTRRRRSECRLGGVLHADEALIGVLQALGDGVEVEPQEPATVPRLEPVVEVEAVDVDATRLNRLFLAVGCACPYTSGQPRQWLAAGPTTPGNGGRFIFLVMSEVYGNTSNWLRGSQRGGYSHSMVPGGFEVMS
jgi:hypothetical protein